MTDILIILFTTHLLGDFYLQPQNLSEKMIVRYRFVLLHSLVKIADEKSFAEYYLIGTFYSLIVVVFSFLIFTYC